MDIDIDIDMDIDYNFSPFKTLLISSIILVGYSKSRKTLEPPFILEIPDFIL